MRQNFSPKARKNNLLIFIYFIIFLMSFTLIQSIFAQNSINNYPTNAGIISNYYLASGIPTEYKLYENSVNAGSIRFDIPAISNIKITIYDKNKAIIKGFLYDNIQPGTHEISISDLDNGNYSYSMEAGNYKESYSMIVSK